jgi:hypothetical protein
VKALYTRNGIAVETKASIYADSLLIEGFGDTQPQEVKLIAVDYSRNESAPVKQIITPLEPPIFHIGESLDLLPNYGGVNVYWENINRHNIAVVLLVKDHNDEYIPAETFYSATTGAGGMYNLDTIPYDFGVYARDRWGNTTPTKLFTLTPLYETIFDRMLFRDAHLPNDIGWSVNYTWGVEQMWNGIVANNSGYSSATGSGGLPHIVTIDLGVTAKVSRVRVYQRCGNNYEFAEGNVRNFEIFGCQAPIDMSGNWDSWTSLGVFESVKPSGLPFGQNTAEDIERARTGEDFFFSPSNPPVRYIRISVSRTWAGGDNFQICELEFFGDNR